MEVRIVDVVGQAFRPDQLPEPLGPEVAFVGRSNVGKSSIINRLIGRKNVARVSNTPGKTRGMFFYSLNRGQLVVVDLPGYGFAKGARAEQGVWETLNIGLLSRPGPRLLVQLIDSRHGPQPIDLDASNWFGEHTTERMIVATKSDKLAKSRLRENIRILSEAFGREVLPTSSETGDGIAALWRDIETQLGITSRTKKSK